MMMQCFLTTPVLQSIKENSLFKMLRTFLFKKKGDISYKVALRHERDQSFLVPVPVPAKKKFWSRSLQKKILVPVPVKNIWVTVPVQKNILVPVLFRKFFYAGPSQKKFWSRSRSKTNLVPVPGPLCSSLVALLFVPCLIGP
jgi:hypothetical protein